MIELRPGPLSGRVLYPDGKTPATGSPVRVWCVADEAFVLDAVTDDQGAYSLDLLERGRYLLVFGDRVTVDVRVGDRAKGEVKTLDVVVPHGRVAFSRMAPEQRAAAMALLGATAPEVPGEPSGGGTLLTVVLIGAGGATAVGLVLADSGSSGGDHHVVSP